MVETWREATPFRHRLACWVALFLCFSNLCCRSAPTGTTDPEAKLRLMKLLQLYKVYVDKTKKGPPTEQALRDFGQKLSAKERDEYLIGDDLDNIFISPRDNQKYVIKYNLKLEPGGQARAVA